ncbi:unnamed protein product [Durusdinium trenchii]|uniref:PNPLA domain-containing protein n=2 Tax=Durusdinium trenchii TaxID=1381693 RepID=A0ABP0MVB8_9DINO
MVIGLGSFVVNLGCTVFLLVRLELILPILNAFLTSWRRARGWSSSDAVLEVGPRIALNMQFVIQEKLVQKVRCGVSLFLVAIALLFTCYLPRIPMLCLMACLWDAVAVLLSPHEPQSQLMWKDDRHGIPYGLQAGSYSQHMVFTGGISLACYVLGVVHFILERFGTEGFQDCDFAGASSGSWAAMVALLATQGAGRVDVLFQSGVLAAVYVVHLFPFPFSLLLPGCQAIESFAASLAWLAKVKAPGAYEAVTSKGKLLIWFFAFSLRRFKGRRCYRFAVRGGPDFESPNRLGAVIAATSVFPFLTSPRLCSGLQCFPAVMDGYFPGKGVSFLPVPDMIAPCVGNTLLFDISGGLRDFYAGDERVQVLDIQSWENFSCWDYTACSPMAVEELFARGVRGAHRHVLEVDAAVKAVFGLDPLEPRLLGG